MDHKKAVPSRTAVYAWANVCVFFHDSQLLHPKFLPWIPPCIFKFSFSNTSSHFYQPSGFIPALLPFPPIACWYDLSWIIISKAGLGNEGRESVAFCTSPATSTATSPSFHPLTQTHWLGGGGLLVCVCMQIKAGFASVIASFSAVHCGCAFNSNLMWGKLACGHVYAMKRLTCCWYL